MRRNPLVMLLAVLAAGAILLSGAAAAGPARPSQAAVVKIALNKKLKRAIVVDGRGLTLYMFTADRDGKSKCTPELDATCARIWPALTSVGAPRAGKGIKASLLGTTGEGENQQVTYNRHPLYHYRGLSSYTPGDRKPGHVRGQGFYSQWYVLSPKGAPIRK
jgi:predicted lipoprotein with Yx(FWY)xxD motif